MKKVKENVREFDGVFIPKSILDSRELSPMLKFLLIEIKCLDNEDGCYASNAHLAERIASSPNSVSNMISELAKKSFVYVSYKDEKAFSGRTININQIKFYGIDPKLPQNNPTQKMEGGTRKVEGHTQKMEGGTRKVEHRKELEKKEEEKLEDILAPAKTENDKQLATASSKEKSIVPTPMFVQTNKMIESDIELIPIVEKMLDDNKATFEMYYATVGYLKANNRDYAVAFSSQFFKDKNFCSLDESGLMKQMRNWSYIFAKVNLEIAQAQKAVNMTLPHQYKTPMAGTPTKKNLNLLSMLD